MKNTTIIAVAIILIVALAIPITMIQAQERVAEISTPMFKVTIYKYSDVENAIDVRVYGSYIYLVTENIDWFRVLKIDPNTMNIVAYVNESLPYCTIYHSRFDQNGYLYIAVSDDKISYIYVYDTNLNRIALYNITNYFLSLGYNFVDLVTTDFEILDNGYMALTGYMQTSDKNYIFISIAKQNVSSLIPISTALYQIIDYGVTMTKVNSTDILLLGKVTGLIFHVKLDPSNRSILSFMDKGFKYGFRAYVVGNYIITDYIEVFDLSTFSKIYEYPIYARTSILIDNKFVYIDVGGNVGIVYLNYTNFNYTYRIDTHSIYIGIGRFRLEDIGRLGDTYNGKLLFPYAGSTGIVVLEEIPSTITPSTVTTTVTTAVTSIITTITTVSTTITTTVAPTTDMILTLLIIGLIGIVLVGISKGKKTITRLEYFEKE